MKKPMIIVGIVFVVLLGFWMQTKAIKDGKRFYKAFNSANIDNRIESVRIAYKSAEMKLDDSRVFVFLPYTDTRLNQGTIFEYTAESGDRIRKEAFSDTLYLYKGSKVLKYTFSKLE